MHFYFTTNASANQWQGFGSGDQDSLSCSVHVSWWPQTLHIQSSLSCKSLRTLRPPGPSWAHFTLPGPGILAAKTDLPPFTQLPDFSSLPQGVTSSDQLDTSESLSDQGPQRCTQVPERSEDRGMATLIQRAFPPPPLEEPSLWLCASCFHNVLLSLKS